MMILWIVLGAIVGLIALVLIAALFVKRDYSVERTIVVGKSNDETFNFLKLLRNQDRFSKWANIDPNMKKEYVGTDGTTGFISKWESDHKQVGHGEQEIKRIVEGERIESELRFLKPFAAVANGYMTTTPVSENETRVAWGFNSRMNYPMNILLVAMSMEKVLAKDFDEGLSNMKKIIEQE
ncbi:MAG TPA: SRPBCC family protein [Fluviicola sp.]|nr:SRPBCC family protein [Fluviicola sp.]